MCFYFLSIIPILLSISIADADVLSVIALVIPPDIDIPLSLWWTMCVDDIGLVWVELSSQIFCE